MREALSPPPDPRDYPDYRPAAGDGVQDDFPSFDTAMKLLAKRGGGLVVVPPGRYRVSQTIQIHPSCSLEGTHQAQDACVIVGDDGLRGPMIEIVSGDEVSVRNLTVQRNTKKPDPVDVGILVRGDCSLLENLLIHHQGIGCAIVGSDLQRTGTKLNRVHISCATTAYCQIRNAVDTAFSNCEFGHNGGEEIGPPDSYVRIEGKTDTINFIRCQFNFRGTPTNNRDVFCGLYFGGVSSGQVLNMIACHMELVAFPFWFVNTNNFDRIYISNCTFGGNSKRLFFVKNNADSTLTPTQLGQSSMSCGHIHFVVRAEDNVRLDPSVWTYPELNASEQKVRDIYLDLVRGYTPEEDWVNLYVPFLAGNDENALRGQIISDHAEKIVRYRFRFFTGRDIPNDWLDLYIPHLKAHGIGVLHDAINLDHGDATVRRLYHYLLDQDISDDWLTAYKSYLKNYGYMVLSEQILADPHPRLSGHGPTGLLPIWRATTPKTPAK